MGMPMKFEWNYFHGKWTYQNERTSKGWIGSRVLENGTTIVFDVFINEHDGTSRGDTHCSLESAKAELLNSVISSKEKQETKTEVEANMSTQDLRLMPIGPPKKRILQALGSSDCVAATCSMIVGCELKDAHAWAGTEIGEPWHDCIAAAFLLSRGFWMGYGVGLEIPTAIEESWVFTSEKRLKDQPCYMAVQSRTNPEYSHAVFWDGRVVWDPHPLAGDGEPLANYMVSDFWPLYKLPFLMSRRLSRLRMI